MSLDIHFQPARTGRLDAPVLGEVQQVNYPALLSVQVDRIVEDQDREKLTAIQAGIEKAQETARKALLGLRERIGTGLEAQQANRMRMRLEQAKAQEQAAEQEASSAREHATQAIREGKDPTKHDQAAEQAGQKAQAARRAVAALQAPTEAAEQAYKARETETLEQARLSWLDESVARERALEAEVAKAVVDLAGKIEAERSVQTLLKSPAFISRPMTILDSAEDAE